jgi:phage-related minor tail protein
MGPGQIPRGILLSRQLLRVYDSIQNSAAQATAAAQHLNLQLAHHSAAASDNPLESNSAYDHSNLLCLPPITSSFSPPSTQFLPANLPSAVSPPHYTRRFSSQATPIKKQNINEKHHYEKRVRDVRKKYIEEMAEKRRREQAFEQKKKEILAAREQQRREARLAAVREGAEEKERLLEERRKEKVSFIS